MARELTRVLLLVLCVLLLMVCAFLDLLYPVSPFFSYKDIALDSADRLYVGEYERIDVFENGQRVATIRNPPVPGRSYRFHISSDHIILAKYPVGKSTQKSFFEQYARYLVDLEGNIVATLELDDFELWDPARLRCVGSDGSVYLLTQSFFSPATVTRTYPDGTVTVAARGDVMNTVKQLTSFVVAPVSVLCIFFLYRKIKKG